MTGKRIQTLRLSQLKGDERVNRVRRSRRVDYLIRNWNDSLFGIPVVSPNGDGRYTIVDGQHRLAALEAMSTDDPRVAVEVIEGATVADQAAIFVGRSDVLGIGQFERFEKRVTAEEAMPLRIVAILAKHGLHLEQNAHAGCIQAVTALERVANRDGTGDILDATLGLLGDAWGDNAHAYLGAIVEGTAQFVVTWPKATGRLVKKLESLTGGPTALLTKARALREIYGHTLPRNVAEQERLLHNAGIRVGKLDWTE